jgi:hypothetical protein
MMKVIATILLIGCLLATSGCLSNLVPNSSSPPSSSSGTKSGTLTTEMAQRAINKWMPSGSGTVQGVQVTQNNDAVADVSFSGLNVKNEWQRVISYIGSGRAIFKHYSDGRWVLKRVEISNQKQGINSWWSDITVDAN